MSYNNSGFCFHQGELRICTSLVYREFTSPTYGNLCCAHRVMEIPCLSQDLITAVSTRVNKPRSSNASVTYLDHLQACDRKPHQIPRDHHLEFICISLPVECNELFI